MNRKDRRAAKSSGADMHGSPEIAALFQQALAHHQAGRFADAQPLYRQILEADPEHAESLHMMGLMANQLGKPDSAVEFISRAIGARDNVAQYHNTLGNALATLGRRAEAAKSYEQAIRLNKDFYEAYSNIGVLLRDERKLPEAAACLEKAIAISPHTPDNRNNFGLVLRDQGKFKEAVEQFKKALVIDPGFVEAYNNLGLALGDQGKHEEAVVQYQHALKLNPSAFSVHGNLGNALLELGRYDESLAANKRSLEIQPLNPKGLINIGNIFSTLKRYAEALPWYEKANELEPENATAYYNRGVALDELGRLEEALTAYDKAYTLGSDRPGLPELRLRLKMRLCDWSAYDTVAQMREKIQRGQFATTPFSLVALPVTAEEQLKCAQLFVSLKFPAAPVPLYKGPRASHDKIRVAYLSADFYDHATAYLMAGLFELHDRSKFELTAISFGPETKGAMHDRLAAAFDHFIDVRKMSDDEVAKLMLEREIDIAVDLKGFTHGCRPAILTKRAAPVQVSYIGFPGTMGAPYIDYIIADKTVLPPEMQSCFTEKAAYLPGSYQVNDHKRAVSPNIPSRAELGLPESAFVFCAFNNNYKITPDIFDVWMHILKGVDNSVLWLLDGSPAVSVNLRREAQQRGVAPERLVFAKRMKIADHLARHHHADLFLDNLPCNAHTTASDALWMGVPVLTCLGATFAGRVAGSLLKAAGVPELITTSMQEYEQLALQLAREPQKLAALKEKLVQNRDTCALFDTEKFTRNLEAAYQTMWQRHLQGATPETFDA
jgi:protein O-GlcNAc transferase